ncbi:MAG: hypothetical protein ACRC62_04715 [Microcoleus sp.]
MAYQSRKDSTQGDPLWLTAIAWLALGLVGWAIWQSVHVYVGLGVQMTDAANAGSDGILRWWNGISLWGWIKWPIEKIVGILAAILSVAAMIFLYALLQLGELAPLLFEHSPDVLKAAIEGLLRLGQFAIPVSDSDSDTIRYLKDKHNSYGEEFFDQLFVVKPICYLVDLGICLYAQPLIVGGWSRLQVWLAAPTLNDIDFNAILKIVVTLFSVEVFFGIWLWIRKGKNVFGSLAKMKP